MTMVHQNNSRTKKELFDERSPLLVDEKDVGSKGASFSGSVFNLSTSIIGAGIMALPAAMKVLGLGFGIIGIVFLALLAESSLEILIRFSRVGKAETYGEVMRYSFGSVGNWAFQICILLNNFGILVVYMIIIGDVLSGTSSSETHHAGVLEGWFGEYWWTGRTFVLLVVILFIFSPLAFFKRIDSLRYSSALAVALAIVFIVIMAGITFIKLFNGSIAPPRLLPNVTDFTSLWKLFTAAPVLVTAFVCHFNGLRGQTNALLDSLVIPSNMNLLPESFLFVLFFTIIHAGLFVYFIEQTTTLSNTSAARIWFIEVMSSAVHTINNELADSSLIQKVVRASLVLCSSVYILTASFGFLLFGESTLDDVLANFDADLGIPYGSLFNDIVRVSYALHLMLVIPVIFFSLRFYLNELLFPSARSNDLDNVRFVLMTTGLILSSYVAANFIPSIWDAFQFTGATATVCLGFIFPAAIALRDPNGIATKKDKVLSVVMIVLAVSSNVVAIYSNINTIFNKNVDPHE